MHIQERYSVARQASSLKVDPSTSMSATDILGAAGMVAQRHEAAMLLWALAFRGKTSTKLALCELLEKRLTGYMLRNRINGKPRNIARAALAWYLSVCPACSGVGHEIIAETITRSDDLCQACRGTGKLPEPNNEAFHWIAEDLAQLAHHAAGQVMRKIDINL